MTAMARVSGGRHFANKAAAQPAAGGSDQATLGETLKKLTPQKEEPVFAKLRTHLHDCVNEFNGWMDRLTSPLRGKTPTPPATSPTDIALVSLPPQP